jgi:hypothetical protein
MKRTLKRNRKYSRKQKGGTTFSTQEKDNLIKDGGFTQEHLDYLATLPEDLGSVFGSVSGTNYDFIKRWQMSVSDMYDIPPTSQNMRELANKTIEDFKFYFERRNQPQEMDQNEENQLDISNISDANISELPSFGGIRHKRGKRTRKQKKSRRKNKR